MRYIIALVLISLGASSYPESASAQQNGPALVRGTGTDSDVFLTTGSVTAGRIYGFDRRLWWKRGPDGQTIRIDPKRNADEYCKLLGFNAALSFEVSATGEDEQGYFYFDEQEGFWTVIDTPSANRGYDLLSRVECSNDTQEAAIGPLRTPFVAISRDFGTTTCIGTIIAESWMITSARCFGRSGTFSMEVFAQNANNTNVCLSEPRPPQQPGTYPCSGEYVRSFGVTVHPDFDGFDAWELCGGDNAACSQNENPSVCYEGCVGFTKFDDEDAIALINIDGGFEQFSGINTVEFARLSRFNVPTDGNARMLSYEENAVRIDTYEIEDVGDRDIEVDDGRRVCTNQIGSPLLADIGGQSIVIGILSEWTKDGRCSDTNDRLDFTRIWEPKAGWIQDNLGYLCDRANGFTNCAAVFEDDPSDGGLTCSENQFCCEPSPDDQQLCLPGKCQPIGTECR